MLPDGYRGPIGLLKQMGRDTDLETVLVAAINRFPTEPWPEIEYAGLEHARKGRAAAATRWAVIRARWPDRRDGYVGGAQALTALGRNEEAAQVANELRRQLPG